MKEYHPRDSAFPDYELEISGPAYLRGALFTGARSLISPCISTTYYSPVSESHAVSCGKIMQHRQQIIAATKTKVEAAIFSLWVMVIGPNTAQALDWAVSLSLSSPFSQGHPDQWTQNIQLAYHLSTDAQIGDSKELECGKQERQEGKGGKQREAKSLQGEVKNSWAKFAMYPPPLSPLLLCGTVNSYKV